MPETKMTTHVTEGPRFSCLCRPTLARAYTPSPYLKKKRNCSQSMHREPTQSVFVSDCYFIVHVLDLPFASPIAIYR